MSEDSDEGGIDVPIPPDYKFHNLAIELSALLRKYGGLIPAHEFNIVVCQMIFIMRTDHEIINGANQVLGEIKSRGLNPNAMFQELRMKAQEHDKFIQRIVRERDLTGTEMKQKLINDSVLSMLNNKRRKIDESSNNSGNYNNYLSL